MRSTLSSLPVTLLIVLAAAFGLYFCSTKNAGAGQLASSAITPSSVPQGPSCGVHCGTERWAVKTLSDSDRGKVNFNSKKTTVGWLVSQEPPDSLPEETRIKPTETQTYQVQARLVGFKREDDQDFHIVLADLNDAESTMIVEIPDPNCAGVCASDHLKDIQDARKDFVDHCGEPTKRFKRLRQSLTLVVTGVGFFDFAHGQTGVADNAVELHPVLKIEFPTDTDECAQFAKHAH